MGFRVRVTFWVNGKENGNYYNGVIQGEGFKVWPNQAKGFRVVEDMLGIQIQYSLPYVDRLWLWVYYNKVPIYPIFYLLKGGLYSLLATSRKRHTSVGLRALAAFVRLKDYAARFPRTRSVQIGFRSSCGSVCKGMRREIRHIIVLWIRDSKMRGSCWACRSCLVLLGCPFCSTPPPSLPPTYANLDKSKEFLRQKYGSF